MKKRGLDDNSRMCEIMLREPAGSGNNYQHTPSCMDTMYVSAQSNDTARDTVFGV
jgi:hypothetical protein